MKFSVIVPAHNEEGCIGSTLALLTGVLDREQIDYEVVVVADHCNDRTEARVKELADRNPRLRCVPNPQPRGFGMAVRCGLDVFAGDAVVVYMADMSDDPADLVCYCRRLEQGAECVFGSRFMVGGKVTDYPWHKLVLNRLGNWTIRALFRHGCNDTTNAFKAYRRQVIDGCRPFLSVHFNLTVELPLKAVIRGYSYEIVPISWTNLKTGVSKLKIREMGSRYLFVILYCFLERLLCGKDYYRRLTPTAGPHQS